MGRPRLNIDRKEVEKLIGLGCTVQETANFLGCSKRTLERGFVASIKKGRECVIISIKKKQYDVAMSGNPALLIWLGKIIVGQKEKVETERDFELTIITKIVDLTKSGKKVEVKSKRKSVSRKSKVVSKN